MQRLDSAALQMYAQLLRLFPRRRREAYADEMLETLESRLAEAARRGRVAWWAACAGEAISLPSALLQAYWSEWHCRARAEEANPMETYADEAPANWRETLAGTALFTLVGLIFLAMQLPQWSDPGWSDVSIAIIMGCWLLMYSGSWVGWVQGFPRWSWAYLGWVFFWALYLSHVSTPGFYLFGISLFGREGWGWRAYAPLALLAAGALLYTCSLHPLRQFAARAWADWTHLSFLVLGFFPLLMLIAFDEIERSYRSLCFLLLTAALSATALAYLRSASLGRRALSLFAGASVFLAVCVWAPAIFWAGGQWVMWPWSLRFALVILAFLLCPALLGLARLRGQGRQSV